MRIYTVKLWSGGLMGELALATLEGLDNVKIVGPLYEGNVDIVFSASYPKRIPQEECAKATIGAFNIHTSLLPEGRGSHPLNWALTWGKEKTGVTIHGIVDTYDAGDIFLQEEVPIFEDDNIVTLRARVERAFQQAIISFFADPLLWLSRGKRQNQALASYAQKRLPEDSHLNLTAPARDIYNLFRSCHPVEYPAYVMSDGKKRIVKSVTIKNDEAIIEYVDR